MNQNKFFKPTTLYKEFMILDLIEKDANITQRKISEAVGISVSMVNSYLDTYEKQDYINRNYQSSKVVAYEITEKGILRLRELNITFFNSVQKIYHNAQEDIVIFLEGISQRGFKNIFLYGAGEVAELLLNVLAVRKEVEIQILGIVDDDSNKIGSNILNTAIISKQDIKNIKHDGLLISTIQWKDQIMKNIEQIKYDLSKVIYLT